ncbi:MAG: hypothetical protein ACRYFR_07745 [Janthinobacterium lividum]
MSRFLLPLLLVIISLVGLGRLGFDLAARTQRGAPGALAPVNPVVGDASFVARFGRGPTAGTPDALRIQTHLAYAEQQLRQRTPGALPAALRQRRAHLLDLLHAYWQAGVFPQNAAPDGQRHPCFIDGTGRICAVGYLVEQTAGRAAAERINQRFQYRNLLDMRDDALGRWVAQSGLSLADCALIQPTYGSVYVPVATGNNIPTGYGTASAVLGGLNVSAMALNASDAGRQAGRWLPWLTVASGTTQLVLGATRFPDAPATTFNGTALPTNESQKLLSMANLGVGTATVLFGAWNLLHRPAATAQGPRTSWNVGPAPTGTGQRADGMSLFLARRF